MLVLNKNLERILIILMTLSISLEATVFNQSQIVVETLLLAILLYLMFKITISLSEILMFVLVIFLSIYCLNTMSLVSAIILIKMTVLPLISIIVFYRYRLSSRLIHIVFFLCLSVIFLQIIVGHLPIPIEIMAKDYSATEEYSRNTILESRPLGLFLSEHQSAFFLAIMFIGYAFKRNLFMLDLLLLYKINVGTALFSLLTHKFVRFIKPLKLLIHSNWTVSVIGLLILIFLIIFFREFLLLILDSFFKDLYFSSLPIFNQVSDYNYISGYLKLFPTDISSKQVDPSFAMPEIGYLIFLFNFGVLYTFGILYIFLTKLPSWRVFILLTLFHVTMISYPLFIYAMIRFQREDNNI